MTTKVHIVNFGPDVVSVTKSGVNGDQPAETVYPKGSFDCYVYEGQDLLVKECKPPATVGPNDSAKGV